MCSPERAAKLALRSLAFYLKTFFFSHFLNPSLHTRLHAFLSAISSSSQRRLYNEVRPSLDCKSQASSSFPNRARFHQNRRVYRTTSGVKWPLQEPPTGQGQEAIKYGARVKAHTSREARDFPSKRRVRVYRRSVQAATFKVSVV